MHPGLILIIIILSFFVFLFFGLKVLGWCILLGIIIFIGALVNMLLETEGKYEVLKVWRKKVWKKYLKHEEKFFKWLDKYLGM